MEKSESEEIIDDSKFRENNKINSISTTSTQLEKYFIHKRMKKPSLLENKQLEKEKEDFQEVYTF